MSRNYSKCPEKKLISAYVDGEIEGIWKTRLNSHIAGCAKCTRRYKKYLDLHNMLRTEGEPSLRETMNRTQTDIIHAAERREVLDYCNGPFLRNRRTAVAAVFLLFAAALPLYWRVFATGGFASANNPIITEKIGSVQFVDADQQDVEQAFREKKSDISVTIPDVTIPIRSEAALRPVSLSGN